MIKKKFILLILFNVFNSLYLYAGDDFLPSLSEVEKNYYQMKLDELSNESIADYLDQSKGYIDEYKRMRALSRSKNAHLALSEDEIKVLDDYQFDSRDINGFLHASRGDISLLDTSELEMYENMKGALRKLRELNLNNSDLYGDSVYAAKREAEVFFRGEIKVGDYVTNDGFVSTTVSKYKFAQYATNKGEMRGLKIVVKPSEKGIFIIDNKELTHVRFQGEALIEDKSVLKVVAIRNNSTESHTDISVAFEEVDKSSAEYKRLHSSGVKAKEITTGAERELPDSTAIGGDGGNRCTLL